MTTDLCTTSSIRACLGVSERELRDDVLLNPIYAVKLTEALLAVGASLVTDFQTTAALTTKTSAEQRFVDVTQTYAAYFVAKECAGAAPMFAPKQITDGKSQMMRIDDPFKNLKKDIADTLAYLKTSLLSAYGAVFPSADIVLPVARTLVVASPIGLDPVTG